ncbi:MAG: transglycosylase domain-containing protein [Christensenellaceae bacterium]|nr:transglycosylase domain-containing protein [Christensenellaceae bacterium]
MKKRKIIPILLKVLGRLLGVTAALSASLLVALVFFRMPLAYAREGLLAQPEAAKLFARDGSEVFIPSLPPARRDYSALPAYVRQVFVAAEDRRFYAHAGIDVIRVFGSLLANVKSGSLAQGASTITQQVVKNKLLYADKTYQRKFLEAIYALQIEQDYSKDQILDLYLSSSYFGKGAYGLEEAAKAYFSKAPEDLSLTEAAALAAALKAPSSYAPHISEEKNKQRRDRILRDMAADGYISEDEARRAIAAPLRLSAPLRRMNMISWFADAAFEEAAEILKISFDELISGGYQVHSTMDAALQSGMGRLFEDEALFPPAAEDGTNAQAAAVALESATGSVLAMIGGREYTVEHGFNRASAMRRQPGSALKPIVVYTPALERRLITPISEIWDQPTNFGDYRPANYGGVYRGWVSLRTAAALSLNIPSVQMLEMIGVQAGLNSMRAFGLEPDANDKGLSLAVGSLTKGLSPLQLCNAYAALADNGRFRKAHFVNAIYGPDGQLLYLYSPPLPSQAAEPAAAYVTTSLLQSAAAWGTASQLSTLQIPIAAKTGTVDYGNGLNRDAWCAAYTPEISVTVWMGFDKTDAQHALPKTVTGGTLPTTLTREIFALYPNSGADFYQPANIIWQNLASPWEEARYEVFIGGTQPQPRRWATPTPEPTPEPAPATPEVTPAPFPLLPEELWPFGGAAAEGDQPGAEPQSTEKPGGFPFHFPFFDWL